MSKTMLRLPFLAAVFALALSGCTLFTDTSPGPEPDSGAATSGDAGGAADTAVEQSNGSGEGTGG